MVVLALSLLIAAASPAPRPDPAGAPGVSYASDEALRRYAQARLLEEMDRPSEALAEYFRAFHLDPHSAVTALRVSEVTARLGDPHQSLEFAERALALEPGNARALWLRGGALFNLGRTPEALDALLASAAADSDHVEYVATLARVAEELGRHDIVARACRRVVALDDQDGEAWFRLAAAEARIARYEAARRALAEALAEGTTRPGALFLEGWIEEGLGNRPRAIELYQEHLKTFPRDDATRRRLVALMAETGREKEAYREAAIISRAAPRDPDALAVEADLAFKAGRSGDAGKALARLAELGPEDPENVRQRIEILGRNHRARDGVALARSWSSGHPGDYRGTMLVARARFLAGERDSAVAEARRAAEQAPDSLAPLLLLARMHQQTKQWAEASEVLGEIWRRDPARTGVALDIAFCREQLGDMPGAEQAARDALAAGPNDPRALNFLGYLLADHNLKLEEAERLIRQAVEREPDNGAFVDSMGWVFYRLGRLAEARRELERAVILTGGDAVVREHLGDVYNDMRLIELAREQYRLCLAGDRSNGRVRSKLDALR